MKRLLASLVVATIALTPMALAQTHTARAAGPDIVDVCPAVSAGYVRCFSKINLSAVQPDASSPAFPGGYHPADLLSAYNLTTSGGSGQILADVLWNDDPNAEADLNVYRKQFGLPPCTTANGCFKKVNQAGKPGPLPPPNSGVAVEWALDVDMFSAICPNCHILLVEGTAASFRDVAIAENTAARLGATVISNSYGGGEFSGQLKNDHAYNHPGVMITASSGDSGYGPQYPAASQYVTAVGGTTLVKGGGSRGWTETVWSGAGSGCSAYDPKPSWQHDPLCTKRTIADVAAVADPNTGVAVYDSYGQSGWIVVGGTSVAAPIIAGTYALAGNGSSLTYGSYSYSHTSSLYDITQGSNGSCGGTYLCTGKKGYDGPTGNGTPNGTGAF